MLVRINDLAPPCKPRHTIWPSHDRPPSVPFDNGSVTFDHRAWNGVVATVDKYQAWEVGLQLARLVLPEAEDDDLIANVDFVRRRAIYADHAAPAGSLDHIGVQALAIGHVRDHDLLVLTQACQLHQLFIDRQRAHVVDIGFGDGRAVNLALQQAYQHGLPPCESSSSGRIQFMATAQDQVVTGSGATAAAPGSLL